MDNFYDGLMRFLELQKLGLYSTPLESWEEQGYYLIHIRRIAWGWVNYGIVFILG